MTDKSDKPAVNFAVLPSVEDYVEKSGKFRTKCASFDIPGRDSGGANAVYIPYCEKQRFDFGHLLNDYRGQGVFTPPQTGKRWQMTDFILFREHFHDIHCPQPCRGYRNKRVVALLKKLRPRVPTAGNWTRKEITIAVVVPVVICLLGALLGWLTPEGRRLLHLDKQQEQQAPSVTGSIVNNGGVINNPTINNVSPTIPAPKGPTESRTTSDSVTAIVRPPSVVDWRDKRNWSHYLKTGITRTDVRQIFGDPEKMHVSGNQETWDYGSGRITFLMGSGTPDGSLYSWDESN